MKTKWVIHTLNSQLPLRVNSMLSALKPQIHQTPSPKASTFVLNHVDISRLLSICGREGYLHLGSSVHASIIKKYEFFNPQKHSIQDVIVIWNSVLSLYWNCGVLADAVNLFDDMPITDTVSWNTMISGFLRNKDYDTGFGLFKHIRESGFCRLDKATLTTVLSAFDRPELSYVNKMIHSLVFLNGFEREVVVGNALITSYFKCGCSSAGRQVFEEMCERNVITWTAMVSGLAQNKLHEDGLTFFVRMRSSLVEPNLLTYLCSLKACSGLQALREGRQIHALVWKLGIQPNLCIESALMDLYSKCGSVEDACKIFESTLDLDEVSITVMLVAFAQNGYEQEAVQIFTKIVKAGIKIDPDMVSATLGVFGVHTSLGLGKQIHSLVIKQAFCSNLFVGNGLINMYSKCGDLEDSIEVFIQMPWRNSVTWNSMIAAFARHGDGYRALEFYEKMQLEGVEPTDVTFLSLLHACSHIGFVDMGMELLKSMIEVHRISPRTEHYSCVVDMLGRAGLLNEAKTFIEELPVRPDVRVWQALLGACCIHGDTETGKYAAEQLFLLEPEKPASYILLANIYSSRCRWKERASTIKRMKEMGVAKETGVSWVEINGELRSFVVEDRRHPQVEIIYGILAELFRLMVDEGYVPDKRFILHHIIDNVKG